MTVQTVFGAIGATIAWKLLPAPSWSPVTFPPQLTLTGNTWTKGSVAGLTGAALPLTSTRLTTNRPASLTGQVSRFSIVTRAASGGAAMTNWPAGDCTTAHWQPGGGGGSCSIAVQVEPTGM